MASLQLVLAMGTAMTASASPATTCNWVENTSVSVCVYASMHVSMLRTQYCHRDYYGPNVGHAGVNLTRQECCDLCTKTKGCDFAVFGSPAETPPCSCWFKSGLATKNRWGYRPGATTCCPSTMVGGCPQVSLSASLPLCLFVALCLCLSVSLPLVSVCLCVYMLQAQYCRRASPRRRSCCGWRTRSRSPQRTRQCRPSSTDSSRTAWLSQASLISTLSASLPLCLSASVSLCLCVSLSLCQRTSLISTASGRCRWSVSLCVCVSPRLSVSMLHTHPRDQVLRHLWRRFERAGRRE